MRPATAAQPCPYTQALAAYHRGDFSAAREWLENVAATSPDNAEARHLLAVLLAREQRFSEAEGHFAAAIQNAPGRHDFRCNHALFLFERGDSAQAATLFRAVLERQPDFAPALNGLGSALFKLGDLAGAEQAFRRALHVRADQPGNPQHHNNLGNVLKERGLAEQALLCYRQALSLQPDYAEAGFNLGVTLKELDRIEEARACFVRVLQLKPDYPQAAEQLEQVAAFWRAPIMGKRLVLRPYGEQDAPFLHRCFRDADFMAHYHQFLAANQLLEKLKVALRHAEESLPWRNRAVDWVICRSGEPVGLANLADLDLHHRRAELLVGIPAGRARYAGAGLEATLLAMDFAFNYARLNKLTSLVYEGNDIAQRNTLELGFKQEGFRPQHLRTAGGGYLGVFENGLTAADFRANRRLAKLSLRLLGRDVTGEKHE